MRPTIDEGIAKAQHGRVKVTPARAIEMAGQLYSKGEFAAAERVCRQLIAARPDSSDAHNILGVALAALGRPDEANEALRRAIEINPGAASYRANLSDVLRRAGQLDDAARAAQQAIELQPDNVHALNNLGIVQYERKQFEEEVACYRRALELRPGMAEALNNLGNALRATGDPEGAMEAYRQALTHRSIYPEAHNNLAQLLSSRKRDVEALAVLGEALKLGPDLQTLVLTAKVQLGRGNLEAAEQAARLALEIDQESAAAMTVLGQLLHDKDRYDEALEVLGQALKAAPDHAEALNFSGVALKSVGRLDEARAHIVKALELNPAMYGAYANLGDLVDFSVGAGAALFDRMQK